MKWNTRQRDPTIPYGTKHNPDWQLLGDVRCTRTDRTAIIQVGLILHQAYGLHPAISANKLSR